ncbi:MAG: flagellar biosynthesis protein FlhF [Rubricoccaceae bacterium]
MTLKTVTGPSTRDALAHARRLFGNDVVLLQSAPAAHGQPASVTVAFDTVPSPDEDLTGPLPPEAWTVAPAHPEPVAAPAPRAYGYSNVRKPAPVHPEPISASPPAHPTPARAAQTIPPSPTGEGWHISNKSAIPSSTPDRAGDIEASLLGTGDSQSRPYANTTPITRSTSPSSSPLPLGEGQGEGGGIPNELATQRFAQARVGDHAGEPTASASEVAALRARLAELEAVIAEVRTSVPPPVLRRTPLVFVGPGGSGKTSLALRLAQSPELTQAQRPAVLIIAPDAERYVDPAPVFWGVGVPVVVAQTPDDVMEAIETFSDADLLLIDTPSLPLTAERARPVVRRLGEMLAPLGDVDVHFVLDATRSRSTVTAAALHALGLTPDALALARLDEAPVDAATWADHLELPIRFTSSGPDLSDLSDEPLTSPTPAPSISVEPVAPPVRSLTDLFEAASVSPQAAFTHVPVLA